MCLNRMRFPESMVETHWRKVFIILFMTWSLLKQFQWQWDAFFEKMLFHPLCPLMQDPRMTSG